MSAKKFLTMDKVITKEQKIGSMRLSSRIVRSATYEGLSSVDGVPSLALADLYLELASHKVGMIVTGFCYISQQGRAMQPFQSGIANRKHLDAWRQVVVEVKQTKPDVKLVMQLAHAGRQTLKSCTKQNVVGAGKLRSPYFKQRVHVLNSQEVDVSVDEFVRAAFRAKCAGFDGIQVHGAHGYLIHQFLSPRINKRKDKWGERSLFLVRVLEGIRAKCGTDFAILVKLSHADDLGLTTEMTLATIKAIASLVDAVEVSYGSMDYALNIFRGACPLEVILNENPLFKKVPFFLKWLWKQAMSRKFVSRFIDFSENYNLDAAIYLQKHSTVPLIPVGGIRSKKSIVEILNNFPMVSLCRPLICEPDLITKMVGNQVEDSCCTNCNICSVSCDSDRSLRCYCHSDF